MRELLEVFNTTLSENNGTITISYQHDILSGYCEYSIMEVNNRFKQKAWILIKTDMGDVIEYIHSNMPLSGEDFMGVDKLIRDHSLKVVQDLHR
jgi:hypothetical protein